MLSSFCLEVNFSAHSSRKECVCQRAYLLADQRFEQTWVWRPIHNVGQGHTCKSVNAPGRRSQRQKKANDALTVCCRTRFHRVGGGYPGGRRTSGYPLLRMRYNRDLRVQRARQTGLEGILPTISVCSQTAPAHHTSVMIQARQAEDAKDEMRDVIVCSHIFALPSSLHRTCVVNAKLQKSQSQKELLDDRHGRAPKCILTQRGIPSHRTSAKQPAIVTRVLRPVVQS